MCAFVIVFELDSEVDPTQVGERLLDHLAHRTSGARNQVRRGPVFLGALDAPATNGEARQIQPMRDEDLGIEILFDGRLDNRSELLSSLGAKNGSADSRLALEAYRRWRGECFSELVGPFTMAVIDSERRWLTCGRDALGDRALYYHASPSRLVIASEVAALLQHPDISADHDEQSVARFFAAQAPRLGATFFRDVREVPPGHRLIFENGRLHVSRYWNPADLEPVRYANDVEYVEHFRWLLTESVRCRLRSDVPPPVLMSGGLDSTSVAALAARELDLDGQRSSCVSWVFDRVPGADERAFIEPMVERFGLQSHQIVGDDEWPLRDVQSWPVHADAPWQGLYCRLQNKAYAVARRAGASALLTGEFGDHLFLDPGYWLRDLLVEKRWRDGWTELRKELGDRPVSALFRAGRARSALSRVLGWRGRTRARNWLTARGRELVESTMEHEPMGGRVTSLLDPRAAQAASLEVANASRAGVEIRRPFRDRRLIEWMLSIPAHLLYRPGWTKWILRQAMVGILPERVRCRRQVTSLLPLAVRGLVEKESRTVQGLLDPSDAAWRRYVRADWLAETFPSRLRRNLDGIETVIPWQCLCFELWTARRRGELEPAKVA